MDNGKLFYILQLAGGTFPTGGFSQSWGLETYVTKGIVKNAETFISFVESYLKTQMAKCEGPLTLEAMRLAKESKWKELHELEEISESVKLTKESREGSLRMGKALMRIASNIINDFEMSSFYEKFGTKGITYSTAYGLVCGRLGLDAEEAFCAYVFSTVNGLTQSGIKLVPLGNTEAQKILLDLGEVMSEVVNTGISTKIDNISNFSPGLDIAGIHHETLPVRLYMS